jgi:hypothetical protein
MHTRGENTLPIELPGETGQTNVPNREFPRLPRMRETAFHRDPFSTAMLSVGSAAPHPFSRNFPSMLKSSPLFLLAMAAVLCLAGCGPAASGKSAKKTSKKPAPKKVEEPFVPPPPPPKVDQSAFASVDDAMTKVEELVKNQDEKTGKEMLIVETWLQMQGDKIVPELSAKIKDTAGPLPSRITACRVMMKLGPTAATPVLMEATASEPRELRVKAIECLGRLKPTTKEIVEKVIGLIDDPDFEQRKAALGALANIGKPGGGAKDRLQAILNDTKEDETIRSLAKKALKAVDPRKGLMNAY